LIVCHCEVVSDRRIRAAVVDGACDVDDVGRYCAAGTHCGGCRSSIQALLATLLRDEREQPAA
jgi:bacterioferritin-associated ferredoxin